MDSTDYQKEAKKTLNPKMSELEILLSCGLGLAGETGEICDMMKKVVFHHKDMRTLDDMHLQYELGDLLWYIATLCNALGYDLGYVMSLNIEKLRKRHGSSFTPIYESDSTKKEEKS